MGNDQRTNGQRANDVQRANGQRTWNEWANERFGKLNEWATNEWATNEWATNELAKNDQAMSKERRPSRPSSPFACE